jgi:aminoglycoside N3'-acetyltransferase
VRSRHPIWSSSANGAKAREFLEGHEFADPPFGMDSPWGRLRQAGGYILMLGVGLRALTLVHAAMDMIDEEPFPVYTEEKFPLRIVESDGKETTMYSKAHSGKLDGVTIINSLVGPMDQAGLIRRARVGHIQLHYLPVRESIDSMIETSKKGLLRRRYLKDV